MSSTPIDRIFTRLKLVERAPQRRSLWTSLRRALLVPVNLLRAAAAATPGVRFHFALMGHALRGLFGHLTLAEAHELIVRPMDSVRYFEFEFLWQATGSRGSMGDYLDVSSPRLFSLRVLLSGKAPRAVIANPDIADLSITKRLFNNAGVSPLCEFRSSLVSELAKAGESFDTISCISVLEHIPPAQTRNALADLWHMLKPGGKLLLTLPCAKEAFDEYVNFNEYGLLSADDKGFVFGQRFFNDELLRSEIFAIAGAPSRMAIFGEVAGGESFANRKEKLENPNYPYWREPLFVAESYQLYAQIGDLPGLGVVGLEFVKP